MGKMCLHGPWEIPPRNFSRLLQGQSHSKTEQPPRSWGGPDWNHLRSDAGARLPTVLVHYLVSKQT